MPVITESKKELLLKRIEDYFTIERQKLIERPCNSACQLLLSQGMESAFNRMERDIQRIFAETEVELYSHGSSILMIASRIKRA